jgi:hypothetical protein
VCFFLLPLLYTLASSWRTTHYLSKISSTFTSNIGLKSHHHSRKMCSYRLWESGKMALIAFLLLTVRLQLEGKKIRQPWQGKNGGKG